MANHGYHKDFHNPHCDCIECRPLCRDDYEFILRQQQLANFANRSSQDWANTSGQEIDEFLTLFLGEQNYSNHYNASDVPSC